MKQLFTFLTTVWIGLSTHKLRSFLTILGVVIGVAAVISLMAIGKGATDDILSRIESMGSDLITIRPGARIGPGGFRGGGNVQTLTLEDADAIERQVSNVEAVAPYNTSYLQLVVAGENTNAQVIGTTPEYLEVQSLEVASGTFFSDYDYQRGSKVAVLGAEVKETLFGDVDPVGQQVRMGSIVVRVIGVLESKESLMGSPDDVVLIPLTALQQTVALTRTAQGESVISSIALTVSDEEHADTVVTSITSLLRERHRLDASTEDDFNIMSVEEISETITEATGTMTLLLGAIAAISLLVGGIGVMNIMLVSVLERTREIGIRKALGAREWEIALQFLVEAAALTLVGGIIGVILGWLVAFFVNYTGFMTTIVTADVVLLAVGVSAGIGLVFGFMPALNASRLNPIEALRSE